MSRTEAGGLLERKNRRIGIAYMLLSALAASSSGILVRLVEGADAWQILSWRSLAFAGLFFLIACRRYRSSLPAAFIGIGWIGLLGSVCLGLTYVAYLTAMFLTPISAAVIIFSLSPFFAGVAAMLFLNERPKPGAWIWMLLALSGVAVVMLNDPSGGTDHPRSGLGMLVALSATLGYALSVVILRAGRSRDLRPGFILAGAVAFAISGPLAGTLVIPVHDALIGITLGLGSLGLQYLFLERAARHLQAEEITLIALVEVFISPLWVWIGVGEVPTLPTLIGGCAVVAAVAGFALGQERRSGTVRHPDDGTG